MISSEKKLNEIINEYKIENFKINEDGKIDFDCNGKSFQTNEGGRGLFIRRCGNWVQIAGTSDYAADQKTVRGKKNFLVRLLNTVYWED